MNGVKVSEREKQCLRVLFDGYSSPEQCVLFYSHITTSTGLELTQARRAVRALARKGLAERSSCFDDEGMIQGSGYCCTDAGAAFIETSEQSSTQNSPPVELAPQNSAERMSSSDAASAGGETVPSTHQNSEAK